MSLRELGRKSVKTLGLATLAAIMSLESASAATCGNNADGFDEWLAGFRREAVGAGISPRVVDASLADVAYDDSVISHDRGQRAFSQSFATFSAKRLSGQAVKRGRNMLLRYAEPLEKIERRYGVPGPVLIAIWGLETGYGASSGNYPTFSSLATLAYDCRRAEKFREELLDALKLVQRGVLEPSQMRGAWAGEIGQTQFMPSSYLKYAVNENGMGAGDLINSPGDALASTANFLHSNGWQRGGGWNVGQPNFAALLEWNNAEVYARTIATFAEKIAAGAGDENQ